MESNFALNDFLPFRLNVLAQTVSERLSAIYASTVSRAVQELQNRGLIARKVSSADKRSFTLALTSEGRRMFRQLLPLVLEFERKLMASISDADARALLKGLAALETVLLGSDGETE